VRPSATKASLYRRDVTAAAVAAVHDALAAWQAGARTPPPPGAGPAAPFHGWRPLARAADRAIDWAAMPTGEIARRIRSADGFPGVASTLFGAACRLFDVHEATAADLARTRAAPPGVPVARRGPALLCRTVDGGLWIGHVRRDRGEGEPTLKLAATRAFAAEVAAEVAAGAAALPELPVPLVRDDATWDELRYRESGPGDARVGRLSFEFHNGAMSTRQCRRLADALREIRRRPLAVLVLDGGADFFSNGIHLHDIEAATLEGGSAADASMANIEAIDDVALELLMRTDLWTVAALRGNAGAGGCFLALACNEVWAHGGVVLNPHYRNMGNLYGSEYWTYSLPRRIGQAAAQALMRGRLPMSAVQARDAGLVDELLGAGPDGFEARVAALAAERSAPAGLRVRLAAKLARRVTDEARRPLARYRDDELARMRHNFYGFDPSYHVARHHFVHRKPHAWTPRHLALHRAAPARGPASGGESARGSASVAAGAPAAAQDATRMAAPPPSVPSRPGELP
jgi:putative two-component system hydrogenase maturation factor HypX/HoxX